jgi:hypothetical protein
MAEFNSCSVHLTEIIRSLVSVDFKLVGEAIAYNRVKTPEVPTPCKSSYRLLIFGGGIVMEVALDFKECVKQLLCQYEYLKDEDSEVELIFDDERMRYMALWVGWHKYKRVHQCIVHIDIVGDRIFIQCNDTEDSLVAELVERGIPQENISLGFIHPKNPENLKQESIGVAT